MRLGSGTHGVRIRLITRGKSLQNTHIESFDGLFRRRVPETSLGS